MQFFPTTIAGAMLIEPEWHEDERGGFARTWCEREFRERGLNPRVVQCSQSHNRNRGTLRGLHYQACPQPEVKLVRCVSGAIFDVIVDLRTESPTFMQSASFELTANNHKTLYVPEGVAHGFQTLVDGAMVVYQMSEFYDPELQRGVRWNDPAFGIRWPVEDPTLSAHDRAFPDFSPEQFAIKAEDHVY